MILRWFKREENEIPTKIPFIFYNSQTKTIGTINPKDYEITIFPPEITHWCPGIEPPHRYNIWIDFKKEKPEIKKNVFIITEGGGIFTLFMGSFLSDILFITDEGSEIDLKYILHWSHIEPYTEFYPISQEQKDDNVLKEPC